MSFDTRKGGRKGPVVAALGSLLFLLLFMVQLTAAQGSTTFKGEITDDRLNCTQAPRKAPDGLKDDKYLCVVYWAHYVQPPGRFVLYNAETKTTYELDEQSMAQSYAGAKMVEVTGTLDAATKTIKIASIKVP